MSLLAKLTYPDNPSSTPPARSIPKALFLFLAVFTHNLESFLYVLPTVQFGTVGLIIGLVINNTLTVFLALRLNAALGRQGSAEAFFYSSRRGSFTLLLLCVVWKVYVVCCIVASIVFVVAAPREGRHDTSTSQVAGWLRLLLTVFGVCVMLVLVGYILVTMVQAGWRVVRPNTQIGVGVERGVLLNDIEAEGLLSESDEDEGRTNA